jgi:predicted RNA-binding protein with PUA-like domain
MAYWLVKSEPETWSWDMQVKKGTEPWNGVRNFTAMRNLKDMKKGDQAFFYHSGDEKAIVGIVEVVRESYPDHTAQSGPWVMVDFKAVKPVKKPVTLAEIKADPKFKHLDLVRLSRLSVGKVDADSWNRLCKMGEL